MSDGGQAGGTRLGRPRTGGPLTWPGRVGLRVLDAPVRSLAIAVVVLVLGVSSLFGGLDRVTVTRDALPTAKAGTPYPGKPWTVTIERAAVFDGDLPPLRLDKEGDLWLQVLAIIEITADESRNDMRDILSLDIGGLVDLDPRRDEPKYLYLSRDATILDYLHPGMPERVAFFWELAATAPVPKELHIMINGKTRRIDSLSGRLAWLDPGPRAELRVPVEDRRGA